MVAVAVARSAVKAGDDDVRPVEPHDANAIAQHILLAPVLERLVHALRESEIGHAGKELVNAVISAGCQEFLGAHQAQRVEQLRSDEVRAAFAAVEREQPRTHALGAGEPGDERPVLIVRMSGGVKHRGRRPEPQQALVCRGSIGIHGGRMNLGPKNSGQQENQDQETPIAGHGCFLGSYQQSQSWSRRKR